MGIKKLVGNKWVNVPENENEEHEYIWTSTGQAYLKSIPPEWINLQFGEVDIKLNGINGPKLSPPSPPSKPKE